METDSAAIEIISINDKPVLSDKTANTTANVSVDVILDASDVDSDTLTYSVMATPANGSVVINSNVATYTPAADFFGTDSFMVIVSDSHPATPATATATISITIDPQNNAPTLDELSDITIDEDAPEQTINLTGITAGVGETQPLSITAVSDNTGLIPDPTVDFDSQNSTGTLKFTPVADQFGTATITVTVEDGGLDNNLATPGDNGVINRTFSVMVAPINDEPTLDVMSDININEDDPEQTVNLTGITANGGEVQQLSVTAVSDNTGLIPDPTVTYSSADSTGTLKFTPVADQSGTATITVTVEDGGNDNILATVSDNLSYSQTFEVVVEPVNDRPVLNPTASPQLSPIAVGSGSPVGAVGTLVSALIDAEGPLTNYSDVDGDPSGYSYNRR